MVPAGITHTVAASLVTCLGAVALAGCGIASPSSAPTPAASAVATLTMRDAARGRAVDPRGSVNMGDARRVLRAIWQRRERARTDDDAATLRRLDTGTALDRDLGVTADAAGIGDWSARVRRPFGPAILVVPSPHRYPRSFLGVVQTSTTYATIPNDHKAENLGAVALVVLAQNHAGAHWRVALESGGTGVVSELPDSSVAASYPHTGYSAPTPRRRWITPRAAVGDLARYYQYYVDYGTAPADPVFLPGNWTTGQGTWASTDATTGRSELNGQLTAKGYRETVRYYVDPRDRVWSFDFGGADLVCGAVRATTRATPPYAGGYLDQNPGRSNWGGWLAPGAYSSITTNYLHQVCMEIPPDPAEKIQVLTGDDTVAEWLTTGQRESAVSSLLHAIA